MKLKIAHGWNLGGWGVIGEVALWQFRDLYPCLKLQVRNQTVFGMSTNRMPGG